MGYSISNRAMDDILAGLGKQYRIFAPVRSVRRGSPVVRYGEIASVSDIVLDAQSDFSPKEVFYPILQTMFYFTRGECVESEVDEKPAILLARPCDINGISRLDTIFLENGAAPDLYYARRREKLKLFLLECQGGWENCFCVSMGANKTGDYSVALRLGQDDVQVQVKDDEFLPFFEGGNPSDFTPGFVAENTKKVRLPSVTPANLQQVYGLDMWRDYDEQCIGCGGCNTVCGTCSCFDTVDVVYNETSLDGERRRVWAGCMQEGFTTMAGGHGVRKNPGDRIRFKALHKVYDFKARFGKNNMCVGCGRCDSRCPQNISFSHTINRLSDETEKLGVGQ